MGSFWKGKVVLVTGACRGLGIVLVRQLLQAEAKVVLHSWLTPLPKDEAIAQSILHQQALHVTADIRSLEEVSRMLELIQTTFGCLDVLIHNAGISAQGTLLETSHATFDQVLETNLNGVVQLTKLAIPSLIATKGSIFFISSLAAIHGIPHYLSYSITKAALVPLQEGLELELKPHGVHVGLIYLGFVENDSHKFALNAEGKKVPVPKRNSKWLMTKETAARKILKAIEHNRGKAYASIQGRIFSYLKFYFPGLIRHLLAKQLSRNNP